MANEFVTAVAQIGRVTDLPATGSGKGTGRGEESRPPSENIAQQDSLGVDQVRRAVETLNELVQNQRRSLHFSVDQDTGRTVIRVVDPATDEVIRQIPPEEVLNLARHLDGLGGVLLRARA
jgi:flagellar protein FlaG